MISIRLLGPVQALSGGVEIDLGAPKARAVLALLALDHGRGVAAARLIDDVWGGRPPASAAKALQVYVSQLRKTLGPAAIATEPHGYRLAASAASIDVADFEARAAAGRTALAAGHADVAATAFAEALALWRGDALEDLRGEPGLAPVRAHLDELRLVVEELRGDALLAAGGAGLLLPVLVGIAREHPLRERFQEQLMLALYRSGRQADALDVYAALRRRLHDELGLEPSPRVRELQQAILRQDESLAVRPARTSLPPVIAAGRAPQRLALVAGPLAHVSGGELVLLTTVAEQSALTSALDELSALRGDAVRVAAFVSRRPAADVMKLAAREVANLVVLQADRGELAEPLPDAVVESTCDVALFVDGDGEVPGGRVCVLHGGADEDWAGVELATTLARATGRTLRLIGARVGDEDASLLLARSSLAVQRFGGIAAEGALFEPGSPDTLREATGGGLLVAGVATLPGGRLPDATTALGKLGAPLLLVRRGSRTGLLQPSQTWTRFSWSR
jgi:DNA-binding SARP family transcriptional activator